MDFFSLGAAVWVRKLLVPIGESVVDFRCTQFCTKRAASCSELAQLNISPLHRIAMAELAAYWNEYAAACDREAHPWTEWCQSADVK